MNSNKVTIIDYGLGNLFSIAQAIIHTGGEPIITSDKETILNSEKIILPGVGAFGDAMYNLKKLDLVIPILDYVNTGKPLMGICLGMQLLFDESEEFGVHKGLGIIPGVVKKFPSQLQSKAQTKIPQIAWNQIYNHNTINWSESPLSAVRNGEFMYFVHSYFVSPDHQENILAESSYADITYCSAAVQKNVHAFQFHPEKSTKPGLSIYANFLNTPSKIY